MTDIAKPDWEEVLRTLLALRLRAVECRESANRAWDVVVASKEYRWFVAQTEARKFANTGVEDSERLVRQAAVEAWRETGEKSIAPGLSIRMMKALDYSDADALRYCKSGLDAAIALDRNVFEKVMFAMDADVLPSFVRLSEKPTATIATDLEKALA